MKNRPLASLYIAFYNQENFVQDAVEGALSQDYENLEIILSDDCSSDNTYEEIQRLVKDYKGPHQIIVNRNEKNLGISEHVNKMTRQLCNGVYLLAAGGDDVSEPTRVSESVDFLESHPEVVSLTFQSLQVDVNLKPISDNLSNASENNTISIYTLDDYCNFNDFLIHSGDSRAFRRALIDSFPPLEKGIEEDLEMFVRSFQIGQVAHIRKPLVKRRVHGNNVSKKGQKRAMRKKQYLQLKNDAQHALDSGYITLVQKRKIDKKIQHLYERFCENDDRRNHKIIHGVFKVSTLALQRIKTIICNILDLT